MEITNLPIKMNRKTIKRYSTIRNNYISYENMPWKWLTIFRAIERLKKNGRKSYIKLIAEKYNIKYTTLKNKYYQWLNDGKPMEFNNDDNRGLTNRLFTINEERELYEYIKTIFIDSNLFIDDECIKILAKKKWDLLYSEYKDSFLASNCWIYEFKKRWRLSTRTANPSRIATNIDPKKLNKFYEIYDKATKNIDKQYIFNMDETFWRLINGAFNVIGIIGTENRKVNMNINPKEGFTSILIISANGDFLKPIIILKGKTQRCLKKTGLKNDSIVHRKFNNNGWIDIDIMNFVLDQIYLISNGNKSLLILDNYSIHTNDLIIKRAKSLNIQLLFVPPGRTSLNQPLDVSINGALKSIGKRIEKEIFLSNPFGIPQLSDAIKCLIEAKQCIKKQTIINAFTRACNKPIDE